MSIIFFVLIGGNTFVGKDTAHRCQLLMVKDQ